ncbi:hypothetical protein Tco_0218983 [Tanacetum coccineum]
MEAKKKVDLENPFAMDIFGPILAYLQEDESKYKLKFMLDRKDLTLTLDDFRTIFHLPQATDNNHDHFVSAPKFSEMVPFYINNLVFTLELRSTSNFKTTGLLQPWQTLCKIDGADDLVLQDTIQVNLEEQKSHEEDEARENVENVKEHLMAKEIEKLAKEEEESAKDNYKLQRREKGKRVEEIRNTPSPTTTRSPRIPTNLVSSDTEKLQELTKTTILPSSSTPSSSLPKSKLSTTNRHLSLFESKPRHFRRYKSFFQELQGRYGYLFEHLLVKFMPRRKFNTIAKNIEDIMMETLPKLECQNLRLEIFPQVNDAIANNIASQLTMKDDPMLQKYDVSICLALKIKYKRLQVATTPCRPFAIHPRDQDDPHDDAYPEGDNNSYAIDDDVLPNEKVSQELVDEISQTIDEAKLRTQKMCLEEVNHRVRKHKEIIVPPYQSKPTPVVQSYQRDPKDLGLPLVNQVIFPDNDIEERTTRLVKKCVKKFNPYARDGVEQ